MDKREPSQGTSATVGDECLRDFIAAWKEEFGEELPEGEARIRLHELVEFYLLVAKRLPEKPIAKWIA